VQQNTIFVKLALVTETFPPEVNGVAMTFGVIARELGRRGHAVKVYRPRRDDLQHGDPVTDFTEVPLPGMPIPRYPQLRMGLPAGGRLRREWTADRPSLVHVATEGPLGASAITAARTLGIPVTSSFHTNFHAYTRHYGFAVAHRLVLGWLRHVHNRTRRTFAPTRELVEELTAFGFRDVALLSRGVDTWQFHPARRCPELRLKWGVEPNTPVVIHVGRMAAEKNYELLFQAYAAMRAANPQLRFVLAGEGPLKARLQREHPDCIFAGFFSRKEIGRYYASADIYIHASLTETFGNVLTEAMASGLAVAGFDYAAARQFVRHGQNGLVTPVGNPNGLIDLSVMLATDDLLRAQLRTAARAAVERQSWETVIAQFETDLAAAAGVSLPRASTAPATEPRPLEVPLPTR
jgi:glycosyltransferase involved in cell wall biosynthesis